MVQYFTQIPDSNDALIEEKLILGLAVHSLLMSHSTLSTYNLVQFLTHQTALEVCQMKQLALKRVLELLDEDHAELSTD
jgi:hypothetical protein